LQLFQLVYLVLNVDEPRVSAVLYQITAFHRLGSALVNI
jgi:hypothetical protein